MSSPTIKCGAFCQEHRIKPGLLNFIGGLSNCEIEKIK